MNKTRKNPATPIMLEMRHNSIYSAMKEAVKDRKIPPILNDAHSEICKLLVLILTRRLSFVIVGRRP